MVDNDQTLRWRLELSPDAIGVGVVAAQAPVRDESVRDVKKLVPVAEVPLPRPIFF